MSRPDDPLAEALAAAGLDTVDGAFAYQGGQELAKPSLRGRRRTRIELTGRSGARHVLYLKRYDPEPLAARLKRWWTYGLGAGPAGVEVDNIRRARQAGLETMEAVAFGQERGPLGPGRGYTIVSAVPGEALERRVASYLASAGPDAGSRLADELASLVRRLHQAGFVHRDLYAGHIFLDDSAGRPRLYLIDLARMFRPRWRVFRWRVKDLAQLKFSMPPQWVHRHWGDLLAAYLTGGGEGELDRYNRSVDRKAAAIARRHARKVARMGMGPRQ